MHPRAYLEVDRRQSEMWTREDAEAWKEADVPAGNDAWLEEDCLLDNDLWVDGDVGDDISISGLRRLGIRVS